MDKKLKNQVLEKIKPDIEYTKKVNHILKSFLKEVEKSKLKLNYDCDFFIGGSFSKDTNLKDSSDVDIFVRFDKKYDDSNLSLYLEKILIDSKFLYKKQKGSRDYFNVEFKKRDFYLNLELVPVKRIDKISESINSTDVSCLHVDFIKKQIQENPKLKDEIRLAKQFFKAKKLYGAESYIEGFSGHSIDILISYYQSLESLLNSAKNWKEKTFIDINNYYKNYDSALKYIDSSKISSLILVDPILKTRNATRALNIDNYFKFLVIAKNFDKLREVDFRIEKFDLHKTIKSCKIFTKKNNLSLLFYVFDLDQENINTKDIIGSKLQRLKSKFEKYFQSYDFEVFSSEFFIDFSNNISLFVFFFEHKSIPKLKKLKGPFVYMDEPFFKFIKNKDYYFVEKSRVYSYEKRSVTNIKQIANIKIEDCQTMLNNDISFIKKIKVVGYN